jgi:hypothetical protein
VKIESFPLFCEGGGPPQVIRFKPARVVGGKFTASGTSTTEKQFGGGLTATATMTGKFLAGGREKSTFKDDYVHAPECGGQTTYSTKAVAKWGTAPPAARARRRPHPRDGSPFPGRRRCRGERLRVGVKFRRKLTAPARPRRRGSGSPAQADRQIPTAEHRVAMSIEDELVLAHFIVSADVERSRRFYSEVLGGRTVIGVRRATRSLRRPRQQLDHHQRRRWADRRQADGRAHDARPGLVPPVLKV